MNGNEVEGVLTVPDAQCPNPKCGAVGEVEMRNYEVAWHEGDVHCARCGAYIRRFDAG